MLIQPEVFFQPASAGRDGQRLYILHRPALFEGGAGARGAVLYVHPFAEEMNKARRMATLQARALSRAGFAVLQVDLFGCGDSSGDFGDATWDDWVADVVQAGQWLRARYEAPLWLWGLRAGCLLAVASAPGIGSPCDFLFWHPATNGRLVLQQFLRLKAAAQLADGGGKAIMAELRADLAAGKAVQVAGYVVHPRLAGGLDAAALAPALQASGATPEPAGHRRAIMLEVSTQAQATLGPATAAASQTWAGAGYAVESAVVQGPLFWQTTEIEDAPALVARTVDELLKGCVAA